MLKQQVVARRWWILLVLLALAATAAPAVAVGQPAPRVVEVVTAATDAHDVATLGELTLVATSGGLAVRRAGETVRTLGAGDGLPGARQRSVTVLGDRVWAGGVEGTAELALDEAGELRVVRTLPLRRVSRAARFANATWLATHGDGLFRLDDGARSASPVVLGPSQARLRVSDLAVVGGELWAATGGAGVIRVAPDGRVLGRVRQGLDDTFVWDLELAGDRVLLATMSGITVARRDGSIDPRAAETRASTRFPVRDTRSLALVGDHLFAATWGGGVHRIDRSTGRSTRLGARDDVTNTLVVAAAEGAVLVGHETGLARATTDDHNRALTALVTGGLPSSDVTALAHSFGALYVGTFGHGLARIARNGRVERLALADSRWPVDARINDLETVAPGTRAERLYVATDRGLYAHDGRRFVPIEDPNGPGRTHVTALHLDRRGALWVTSARQLSRLAGGRWTSFRGTEDLPVLHLHAVTTDARGRVWVGSVHGLFRLDPRTGAFHRESVASGALPVDWVTALEPWRDGVVVGTYHGGLSYYDGARFRIERERAEGLPAGWVNPHAMRMVDGALFVGTLERGLVAGDGQRWAHLRTRDGLPSDDVTDIVRAGERTAWVATRGGLARVAW